MKIRRLIGGIWAWGLLSLSASPAAPRYVNVSNATPAAPFTNWGMAATSIQPAIDAAASGDEILVAPGTYYLSSAEVYIPPEKALTLRRTQRRVAIIDAQQHSRGLQIQGTNSWVEGFTVRSGGWVVGYGGGLLVGRACTVRDCLVTGNWAGMGAGIFVGSEATNALVEDCTIEGNTATNGPGGGVVLYENSRGRLNRCIIRNNGADYGGGVWIMEGGSISNCRIIGNRAGLEHGGGVYMDASGTANPATLVNSVIASNMATRYGGGVYSVGPAGTLSPIVNCTIVSNEAGEDSGGTYAYTTRFVNDILYFNVAPTNANLNAHDSEHSCIISNCCTTSNYFWPNLTNAPAFVDASAEDFRLATASPGIDAGTTNGAPRTDIAGNPRPRIGMPQVELPDPPPPQCDMGAYEYGFHFNDVRFIGPNTVQLRWDVQNLGIYKLDVETNGTLSAPWITNVVVFTNAGLMPGQFLVHTQTVVIADPPIPAKSNFRLRISRYFL